MRYEPTPIIEKEPAHQMNVNGVLVQSFYVNNGEGVNNHEHDYSHVTLCHSGKIRITNSYVQVDMDSNTPAILIKGDEWHQIEALENNTIFISVFSLIDPSAEQVTQ